MPYNPFGDLYKAEVVVALQKLGCNVKNVHALNLILEEMGLQIHSGNNWITTLKGAAYTIYKGAVCNADAWHPSIVKAVYDFLNNKK